MKEKEYIYDIPHLMQEWDYGYNLDLDPLKITCGSSKKAWWKCRKCGGKWQSTPDNRTRRGLPFCNQCKRKYLRQKENNLK